MVAQALHIDRALLYRYMNDQAFPEDTGFLEQLRNELCLTPLRIQRTGRILRDYKIGRGMSIRDARWLQGFLDNLLKQPQSFVPLPKPSPASIRRGCADPKGPGYDLLLSPVHHHGRAEHDNPMNMQPDQDFVCKAFFKF